MEMKEVRISPRLASSFLLNNKANRPISKCTVDAYARDMLNNKWSSNTGTAISIAKDGSLLDGQHRLSAIVQSGKTVRMWVCYGCDLIGIYDSNRKRTVRDQLNMSRGDLPAVMRNNQFLGMVRFLVGGHGRATTAEIESYIDKHRDTLEAFTELGIFRHRKAKIFICPVYVALYWAFINGVSSEKIVNFVEILMSGISTCPCDYPVIAFRNKMLESFASSGGVAPDVIKSCQGALKKYITGSCARKIKTPKDYVWTDTEVSL